MKPWTDEWQERCDEWLDRFLAQNLVIIGYMAWNGFTRKGRGIVVCEVEQIPPHAVRRRTTRRWYQFNFLPAAQVAAYCRQLAIAELYPDYDLEYDPETVLNDILNTYDPEREVPILVHSGPLKNGQIQWGQIEIDVMRRLILPPPQCYAEVVQRWAEFQPCFNVSRRIS